MLSIPILYQSELIPDSLVVIFNPSVFPDEPAELWLDELAFINLPTAALTKGKPQYFSVQRQAK